MRHLPNIICLLRIALVWPTLLALQQHNYALALGLFLVASISDGLDGWLAKHFNWTSELGKWLDPVADKLLLVAVFLVCTWQGLIPRWLTVAAVARDVMIGLGALLFLIGWGPLRGRPMLASKINTLLQLTYVLLIIIQAGFDVLPPAALDALAVLTLITVLISGFGYLREFTGRALRQTG